MSIRITSGFSRNASLTSVFPSSAAPITSNSLSRSLAEAFDHQGVVVPQQHTSASHCRLPKPAG